MHVGEGFLYVKEGFFVCMWERDFFMYVRGGFFFVYCGRGIFVCM